MHHFFDPHHERSGKALRSHCHHSSRKNSCLQHAGGAARGHRTPLPGGNLRALRPTRQRRPAGSAAMKPRFTAVFTLLRTELRMVLRDRRILVTSILLPLLLMPLIFLGSSWSLRQRAQRLQQTVCSYAVTGPEAAAVRTLLAATQRRVN